MFRWLPVIALAFPAVAQEQFTVGGRLVFRDGRPVANAEITLSTNGWTEAADPVMTDAQGRFAFSGLGEKQYLLSASRRDIGFQFWGQEPSGGQVAGIQLNRGHPNADILFRVEIPSAIRGVVQDREGNPMAGIRVTPSRRAGPEARGRFENVDSVITDDRGRFRIAHLHWGRYRICATASGDEQLAPPTGVAFFNNPGPPGAYLEGCYESTVTLRPGQTADVNFVFLPSMPVSVRGTISDYSADGGINLALASRDNPGGFYPPATISQNRHFEFARVSPGNYWLDAQATSAEGKPLMARVPIQAGGADIQGLDVALAPAPRIDVVVDAPGSKGVTVGLRNAEDGSQSIAQLEQDGTLRFPALFPGRYWLFTRSELCQRSAKLGGQDIGTRPFQIAEDATATLRLAFTDQCGRIDGEVVSEGKPVPRARTLLLITGTPENAGDYLVESSDEEGKFSYWGLPPGKYSLWEWKESAEWNGDAGDLKSMADRRTVVELKAGEVTKVRITARNGAAE